MPNVLRKDSMRTDSWVASHALRRDSSGCRDEGISLVVVLLRRRGSLPRPWRRVSCRPGAEGADVLRPEGRWVNVLVWSAAGTMRIDCDRGVSGTLGLLAERLEEEEASSRHG